MSAGEISVRCCVVGGGPAGMMLGFLLARAGVDILVLEKHVDFLRDFRGDTIHPSTLEVIHELGLPRSPSPTSGTCQRAAASSCSCRNGTS
jgi:2-polyprenyl-6-methoxyphenol hydroxylase-like FAD-dependent oxidoreductase